MNGRSRMLRRSVPVAVLAVVGCGLAAWGAAAWLGPLPRLDLDFDPGSDTGPAAQTRFDTAAVPGRALFWSARLTAATTSAPTVAGGIVYVRDRDGALDAFDATNGVSRWRVPLGPGSRSGADFAPAVAGDTVYATGWDGTLYALDAGTGTFRWSARVGDGGLVATGGFPVAVAGAVVYVDAHGISAFDAATGHPRWVTSTGTSPAVDPALSSYSMPVVSDGTVFVGGDDGAVYALDAATGAVRWSSATFAVGGSAGGASLVPGLGPTSSVTVAGGVVYAAGRDGVLHALDVATGAVRWTAPIGAVNAFGSAPLVVDGTVYVQSDDALHAFDAVTGARRWTGDLVGGGLFSFVPPVPNGGSLFVVGGDALLHEVDARTGATLWTAGHRAPPPKETPLIGSDMLAVPPAVAGDVMYLASGDQALYAYGLNSTPMKPSAPRLPPNVG